MMLRMRRMLMMTRMLVADGKQLSGRRNLALGLIRDGTDLSLTILVIIIIISVIILIARMIVNIVINIGVKDTWKAAEEPQPEGSPGFNRSYRKQSD